MKKMFLLFLIQKQLMEEILLPVFLHANLFLRDEPRPQFLVDSETFKKGGTRCLPYSSLDC